VITEQQVQSIPLTTSISALTNNQTTNQTPNFTFTATSSFTPTATLPDGVYFQVDGWLNAWNTSSGSNPTFTATLASLPYGFHILYAYAGDGQEGTSNQSSPLTGAIQAYGFLVMPVTVQVTVGTSAAGLSFTVDGTSYNSSQTFTWVVGSSHTLSTTSPQTPVSTEYAFSAWSDSTTTLSDTITVPGSATSYTANFTALTSQTITFANPGTQTVGTPLALSASASSGLTVSFAASGACSVSGTTASFGGAGMCSITASQAGNSTYAPASSVTQTFTVNLQPQTITFANPGAQLAGTSLNLSASASSGLIISFVASGACSVTGSTASFSGAGTCSITASQAGNSTYAAAPSVTQTFTVNAQTQTITFANPGAQLAGTSLTLGATASSGLTVSFSANGACLVSGATASFSGSGSCSITASQAGNSTYAAATPITQTLAVSLQTQTITFAYPGTQTFGTSLTLSATASSGLPISYSASGGCAVSNSAATFTSLALCTITASQAGNSTYAPATAMTQTFPVYLGPQPVNPKPVWGSWYTAEKAQQPKILVAPAPQSTETHTVAAPSPVIATPHLPLLIVPDSAAPAPVEKPASTSPWFVRTSRSPAVAAIPHSTPARQAIAAPHSGAKTLAPAPKPAARLAASRKPTVLKSKTASRIKSKRTPTKPAPNGDR
jgi:hypothetical protein